MKDIELRLSKQPPAEPRRKLTHNFTNAVMEQVEQAQHRSQWSRLASSIQGVFQMHTLTKSAATAIVGVVLTLSVGTTFAALQLTTPHKNTAPITKVSGTQPTKSGNTQVAITRTGCEMGNTNTFTDHETAYYTIRQGSGLTPEKLREDLQAMCEDEFPHLLFPYISLTEAQYEAAWGSNGTHAQDDQYNVTLDAVSGGVMYVTIKSDFNFQTYHHVRIPISPDAKVYQDMTPISVQDLKVGSSLTIVTHTTSLNVQVTPDGNLSQAQQVALAPQGVPLGSSVIGIMQRTYSFQDSTDGYQTMGKDWSALDPAAGYRQLVPFKQ